MGGLVAQFLLGDEQVALQGEDIGEGLAFFFMGGFGLAAEGLRLVELGAG